MKKIILILLFLNSVILSNAATGGPDIFGYIWRDSNDSLGPQYNWIDITTLPNAVQVTGLTDDNTSSFYPIGFQFPYYWYSVSQFKVGSNGYMIFNNGAIASPFPTIPSPLLPNDYIAPFMSDLIFGGTGNNAQCWYWSNLTDTLILSYINVPFWVSTGTHLTGLNTFQVILTAVDSSITFQYALQQGTSPATASILTIGIENNSGAVGLQHSQNTYPLQSYAVKFSYPDSSTYVVKDASTVYNNNPESGALFLSKNGAPFNMSAQVKNTGNQVINPFDVYMYLLSSSGSIVAQDTLITDTLNPGQSMDLSSPNLFSPVTADTYTFLTSTHLTGDATPTNNEKAMEIVVVDTNQTYITLSNTGNVASPASTGITWTGGDAGVGVEIRPPFYPCYLHSIELFMVSNAQAADYAAMIYDNSGPGNGPGALLDSFYVVSANVQVPDRWNVLNITTPILIDSGSVFIGWLMNGEGITIGTDNIAPVSNRTYEIHGDWAIFRYREDRDVMIRANISNSSATAIQKPNMTGLVGEFYPSPSNDKVYINVDNIVTSGELNFSFYNLKGQLVEEKMMNQKGSLQKQTYTFDVSEFSSGVYICKISTGNQEYNRKLIVRD